MFSDVLPGSYSITLCFMGASTIHGPLLMTHSQELTLSDYSRTLSIPLVFELLVSPSPLSLSIYITDVGYDFIVFSLMPMRSVEESTLPSFLLHFSW